MEYSIVVVKNDILDEAMMMEKMTDETEILLTLWHLTVAKFLGVYLSYCLFIDKLSFKISLLYEKTPILVIIYSFAFFILKLIASDYQEN